SRTTGLSAASIGPTVYRLTLVACDHVTPRASRRCCIAVITWAAFSLIASGDVSPARTTGADASGPPRSSPAPATTNVGVVPIPRGAVNEKPYSDGSDGGWYAGATFVRVTGFCSCASRSHPTSSWR